MQQLTCSPCPVYSDVTLEEKVRFLFCLLCSTLFITLSFGAGVLRLVERGAVLMLQSRTWRGSSIPKAAAAALPS